MLSINLEKNKNRKINKILITKNFRAQLIVKCSNKSLIKLRNKNQLLFTKEILHILIMKARILFKSICKI